jgi:hypothetical protein
VCSLISPAQAGKKAAKTVVYKIVHEDFEPLFDAASPGAIIVHEAFETNPDFPR